MQLLPLLLLATSALASPAPAPDASHHQLAKRCSPARDMDVHHGYYPPAPCWQTFDPACQPYLKSGTQQTIDAAHNLVIVYGVDQWCFADIEEELAREADGRKTWGWREKIGRLTPIKEDGILVISDMSNATVAKYQKLKYST